MLRNDMITRSDESFSRSQNASKTRHKSRHRFPKNAVFAAVQRYLLFLSTQVSPPFGRKLKPFVSFQDSSRALRPLIEPISPPPPPVSGAVSYAPSHGGHPCARALQSVTHNYDHYLQSLPQKQKEYHALVVEATESANYPFQRLAAPLLLAKQQQMLIERGLERGVTYWPPEGSREQQRALQTRTVQSLSPYALGGQERQLVNTHRMATQRPPQRQFVDPNAQRRLQPLAPLPRPQLTTTSGGRQQLFVPTSGPPLVSRPLLMPSTVQTVRHVTQRPPQRPLMTSPHSLHMTSPPQPRPQPLRQSQHAATLTPPFSHSSDIRLNRALSVTTTMTSLTAQSAQRFSSLSHSNHVAVSHVTVANATPRQSVVRIAPFVTSLPQPMRASVLRSPTESRASSQAVIQSLVLDPKKKWSQMERSAESTQSSLLSRVLQQKTTQYKNIQRKDTNIPEMAVFPGIPATARQMLDSQRRRACLPPQNAIISPVLTAMAPLAVAPPPMRRLARPLAAELSLVEKAVNATKRRLDDAFDVNNNRVMNEWSRDRRPTPAMTSFVTEMPLNLKKVWEPEDDDCVVIESRDCESQDSSHSERSLRIVCEENEKMEEKEEKEAKEREVEDREERVDREGKEAVEGKDREDNVIISENKEKEENAENKETKSEETVSEGKESFLQDFGFAFQPKIDSEFEEFVKDFVSHLVSKKRSEKREKRSSEEASGGGEWRGRVDREIVNHARIEVREYVSALNLIGARELARKPIAYLNAKYPRNEISRAVYAGIRTKRAVMDFPTEWRADAVDGESAAKRRRLLPRAPKREPDVEESSDRKWQTVLQSLDVSSPLSRRIVAVLPHFQFKS
ncbi:unnamed protein product [Oppiella nova]|uniref:Uncharacterized protein n=1 Tax=Oppiella nova TaxID=334625 RepID=A0A7R9LXY3_9ACAR|nr:unnamed protein product [Oppiella nova]CAG2167393.1 unnamed protein product [Oppiella nova]